MSVHYGYLPPGSERSQKILSETLKLYPPGSGKVAMHPRGMQNGPIVDLLLLGYFNSFYSSYLSFVSVFFYMYWFSSEVFIFDFSSSNQSIDKKILRLPGKTTQCDGKGIGNNSDEIQEIMR